MYLAHVTFRLSLTEVGRLFDRDRTTVAHACAVVEDLRDDQIIDRALTVLAAALGPGLSHRSPVTISRLPRAEQQ
jgi:Bacterial dnaA protein helix-turn-helix